jgi:carbon monoxide dehydrogenase subunit G
MKLTIGIEIKAPKEKIWEVITDIENSVNTVSGIDKIEILNKPKDTLSD